MKAATPIRPSKNAYVQIAFDLQGIIYHSVEDLNAFLQTNTKPIIVELCSGSGQHLLQLCAANPESFVIGFEMRFKRVVRTVEKSRPANITNFVMGRINAKNISSIFSPQSIEKLYINFPDPWEKRRDEKNLLLTKDFIKEIWQLLKPEGYFYYKTDHKLRFQEVRHEIEELKKELPEFYLEESDDLFQKPLSVPSYSTEFEQMFRAQGERICALRLVKGSF
jgi:tRNA (guanine-N7-)-methyltransferase